MSNKTNSVLPMNVIDENNNITETIIVDSVSGGKDYVDEMPRRLSLTRIFADGRAICAEYLQVEEKK